MGLEGINMGNVARALAPSPFTMGAQTALDMPFRQEAIQDYEAQRAAQKAQAQQAQQQAAMQMFDNKSKFYGSQLLANPSLASNPDMVKNVTAAYKEAGMPPPLNADGSLSLEPFKKPWNAVDDQTMKLIVQMPPDQRKALLDQYSGVPKEMYTTNAFISARDQSTISRNLAKTATDQDRTRIMSDREQLQAALTPERMRLMDAETQTALARVSEVNAQTGKLLEETREMPTRLAQAGQRVAAYVQHMQQVQARGQKPDYSALRIGIAAHQGAIKQAHEAQSELDHLNQQISALSVTVQDPDNDPAYQGLVKRRDQINGQMDSLNRAADDAQKWIDSSAANALAGSIQGAGGGRTTAVPVNPGGVKPSGKLIGPVPPSLANLANGSYTVRGQQVTIYNGSVYAGG